jgi:hypothetical protein
MIRGHFRSFEHEHLFESPSDGETLLRDRLRVTASFGAFGVLIERSFLHRYFINFLQRRNALIQQVAESRTEEWRSYLH